MNAAFMIIIWPAFTRRVVASSRGHGRFWRRFHGKEGTIYLNFAVLSIVGTWGLQTLIEPGGWTEPTPAFFSVMVILALSGAIPAFIYPRCWVAFLPSKLDGSYLDETADTLALARGVNLVRFIIYNLDLFEMTQPTFTATWPKGVTPEAHPTEDFDFGRKDLPELQRQNNAVQWHSTRTIMPFRASVLTAFL